MANRWFIAKNKEKLGPYLSAQLRTMAGSGQLAPTDMVLREGDTNWVPASSVKGLWGDGAGGAATQRATTAGTAGRGSVSGPSASGLFRRMFVAVVRLTVALILVGLGLGCLVLFQQTNLLKQRVVEAEKNAGDALAKAQAVDSAAANLSERLAALDKAQAEREKVIVAPPKPAAEPKPVDTILPLQLKKEQDDLKDRLSRLETLRKNEFLSLNKQLEGLKSQLADLESGRSEEANKILLADSEIRESLAVLNEARKACGLEAVKVAARSSIGCEKHARYLVANFGNLMAKGLALHEELAELKEFTKEGDETAKKSVINVSKGKNATIAHGIKVFLATFYHRVSLLTPNMKEVGIGYFRQDDVLAVCVDWKSGVQGPVSKDIVFYPEEGQKNIPTLFALGGPEAPSPLPAEHQGQAGYPITVTFTQSQKITKVDVKLLGPRDLDVPYYVSTPEAPASSSSQKNTICIIPKEPLARAKTHTVVLKCLVAGEAYARSWSFKTE